ncbi:MAG: DUF4159 domain-containing protein, partial [Alphaproteobacteria bacterium]|nr:DUF4159 domain-containing protein [Alphaproteobacteria bacterium]
DGLGRLGPAPPGALAIEASRLDTLRPGPEHPPGLYGPARALRALNLTPGPAMLRPLAGLPAGTERVSPVTGDERPIGQFLLAGALALLALDGLIVLALAGRLGWRARPARLAGLGLLALLVLPAEPVRAQGADSAAARALEATLDLRLAFVKTGIAESDGLAEAGLRGLSAQLARRTAVEPMPPLSVDLATDDLSLFPFLYWRVTAAHPALAPDALAKVDRYMRTGGTILFDTADHGQGV